MGVNLKDLMEAKPISFSDLSQKTIAVDALNSLYQFLASIRQADGTPLMNSGGEITSHLSGLLYRTTNLIKMGIKPVYVFDGKPPEEKIETLRARKKAKEKANEQWEAAKAEGRIEDARKYAKRTSKLTREMGDEAKKLLNYMGVPVIEAPSEGEAQCTYLVENSDAWAVASTDYDSLLFGSKRLIRGFTMSGRMDLTILELDNVLKDLEITREQLIDLAILVGTDFNSGVYGIGPKKALKAVKGGEVESMDLDFDLEKTRSIFLNHPVEKDYSTDFSKINENKIFKLLVEKHEFSNDRVRRAINELENAYKKMSQQSLSKWF